MKKHRAPARHRRGRSHKTGKRSAAWLIAGVLSRASEAADRTHKKYHHPRNHSDLFHSPSEGACPTAAERLQNSTPPTTKQKSRLLHMKKHRAPAHYRREQSHKTGKRSDARLIAGVPSRASEAADRTHKKYHHSQNHSDLFHSPSEGACTTAAERLQNSTPPTTKQKVSCYV